MSRLTASPFTKPSALEFSRSTATPAETLMSDPFGHSQSMSVAGPPDLPRAFDNDSISSAQVADPGARFRRVSSLAYHSSGLRETRERSAQRNFKSFIIVIPPTSLVHEYGPLGHTLSSGPPHRLGQGLLMPLFPTMYGQLTAIAREFNFPSTAGLCIYLHHSDNGITFTPRISDDTWGQLWAPMAEGAHQAPGGLKPPICGRIEFDIDPQMARWYSSWLSSSQRNPVESMSQPINAHVRASSRTTYDSATVDEQHERPSRPRHIPRKLSLVDRFDVASVLTTRPPAGNTSMTPPEGTSTTALSPIYQTEEPLSAKVDLESRVRSWRASAKLEPTHLAAMGQTSLEPANMPNALPLEEVETFDGSDDEEPLRLEDFTWSISSKGPGSEILDSPTSVSYIQSVHIDARAAGSVCMTPSVCTSFGPSDYTLSPLSESSFRIATPDLAQRFYEDVPSTPSTATSWGPRSVDSYEYMIDEDDMISLDIGQRMVLSPPDSPCTATSWGPGSWPPSPVSDIRAPSVDLGARGVFSCPPTPSTATSWGAPLSYPPSPSTPFYVLTPDAGARNFDIDLPSDVQLRAIHQSAPWAQVESPSEERGRMPWPHVWPYSPKRDAFVKGAAQSQSQVTTVNYPSLVIYAPLYPHFDLYPAPACIDIAQPARGGPNTVRLPISYNNSNLSGAVYPYNLNEIYPASKVVNRSPKLSSHTLSSASYPSLVIYAPVYPYLDLYPAPACANISVPPKSLQLIQRQRSSISTRLPTVYPNFNLYPALYPHNLGEIYGASPATESHIIDVTVASQYPIFNLYPAVYPYVTPYPSSLVMEPLVVNHIRGNSAGYPDFNLYPAVNKQSVAPIRSYGYPDFVLYEPIERQTVVQNVCRTKTFKESPVKYGSQYPSFNLYPAVYPHFDLYPSVDMNLEEKLTAPVRIELGTMVYPVLQIYRPAYPYLELYPSLPEDIFHKKEASKYSYRSATAYPTFNLYPAVYPHFDLYPTVQLGKDVVDTRESSSQMTVQYPYFNLYPAVYPHFDLYPTVQVWKGTLDTKESSLQASVQYPFFNLYPAVYPHFDLYPTVPVWKARVTTQKSNFQASLAYPFFNLYPAMYPYFDLYPVAGPVIEPSVRLQCTVSAANVVYPYLTIYPAVYPHFDLWAAPSASRMQILVRKPQQLQPMAIQRKSSLRSPTRATSKAHLQLHNEVWLAEMMKGTQVKTSYPVVVPPVVPAVVPPVVIASPVAAAPVVAPPAVVPVIASPVVAPVAPSSAPAPAPLGPSSAAIRPSVQTSAPFQPVTTAPSPLRVRSRTSVAGLPASPSPPSRSLPPVTAPPPNRALPRRPDGSPSEASPVLRRSVAFDPRGPLPSRPDVHRVSSLNGRVGSMYASGRRGELPSLPVVDEALTRTNSLNVPPTQLGQQRELSRSQSVTSPNRPVHVRKRDSLVLQRVKAINSGYPAAGEERQHGRSLDMLDNFPAPPVHTRH